MTDNELSRNPENPDGTVRGAFRAVFTGIFRDLAGHLTWQATIDDILYAALAATLGLIFVPTVVAEGILPTGKPALLVQTGFLVLAGLHLLSIVSRSVQLRRARKVA